MTPLIVSLCVQVKKGQDLPKGPEVEIAKMDILLKLLREPEQNTA